MAAPAEGWKRALLQLFTSPDSFKIVKETPLVWVIEDKYPKARVHLLIIPKTKLLRGVPDLLPEHRPLLEHMAEIAASYAGCSAGFHRQPSLLQLHLHVFSPDLSGCKTKKHRESFRAENLVTIASLLGGEGTRDAPPTP